MSLDSLLISIILPLLGAAQNTLVLVLSIGLREAVIILSCFLSFLFSFLGVRRNIHFFLDEKLPKKGREAIVIILSILIISPILFLSTGILLYDFTLNSLLYLFFIILFIFILFLLHSQYIRHYKYSFSEKENELSKNRLELNFLKNQMNPHFLFNHLNNIAASIMIDSNMALDYTYKLSEILRFQLDLANRKTLSLQEEIFFIKCYLDIEKFRLGKRYNIELNTRIFDQGLSIPPLILFPFIEFSLSKCQEAECTHSKILLEIISEEDFIALHITRLSDKESNSCFAIQGSLALASDRMQLLYNSSYSIKITKEINKEVLSVNVQL